MKLRVAKKVVRNWQRTDRVTYRVSTWRKATLRESDWYWRSASREIRRRV